MPVPGLALVGFMEEQAGVEFLQQRCHPPSAAIADLQGCWREAKDKLGLPSPNAGRPDIQDIPPEHSAYLQSVATMPRVVEMAQETPGGVLFKLVEIAPLLAYQFQVETNRSTDLCGAGKMDRLADVLPICLPNQLEGIPFHMSGQQNGVLIKSKSLNLRMMRAGQLGADGPMGLMFAGIGFGVALPVVQVVRFDGRCYLRNGFHRTYGLHVAGATHVPCAFIDATDFAQVGAVGTGATFDRTLLESADPPTCGHFAQGRAYPVSLRAMTRIITLSWSEYVLADE